MTESEALFEELCDARRVPWDRVPVADVPTHDYNVVLGSGLAAIEVKQLDANAKDTARGQSHNQILEGRAPVARVRKLIAKSYRQLKDPSTRRSLRACPLQQCRDHQSHRRLHCYQCDVR